MQPTFPPLLHDVANYVVEEVVCLLGYDAYLEEQHEGWPQVTHGPGKRSKIMISNFTESVGDYHK